LLRRHLIVVTGCCADGDGDGGSRVQLLLSIFQMVVAVGRRLGAVGAAVKGQEEIYWSGDESRVEVRQLAASPAQPSPLLLSLLMMMTSPTMANPFASWPPKSLSCSNLLFFSGLCDDLDESRSFPLLAPEGSLTICTAFNGRGRGVRTLEHLAICLVDDISGHH
jgi:hypothetical protein